MDKHYISDSLVELAYEEIYVMARLAVCRLMSNGRDIYATGIFQWNVRLHQVRLDIDLILEKQVH